MRVANILSGSGNDRYPGLGVPAGLVPEDVEVGLVETGVYVELTDAAALALADVTTAAAAVRAEREGFDAAFVNTTTDCGLEAIRALVGIPVVGCGEAGMRAAVALAPRFGIVQVWPEWSRHLDERVMAAVGVADRCSGIRNVAGAGEEDEVHVAMIEGTADRREQMLGRIVAAATAAVEEDGAETIVLGCTCMSAIAPELDARLDVPVVNPLAAGYLAAEQLVRSGLKPARKMDPQTAARVSRMFESIGATLEEGTGNQLEECAVCVTAQEPAAA